MQTTDLPAISDLLSAMGFSFELRRSRSPRRSHHLASLLGRLVFMPTGDVGVSRKIESDGERRRLKEILLSEKGGDASGGFIVRTAAGCKRRRTQRPACW